MSNRKRSAREAEPNSFLVTIPKELNIHATCSTRARSLRRNVTHPATLEVDRLRNIKDITRATDYHIDVELEHARKERAVFGAQHAALVVKRAELAQRFAELRAKERELCIFENAVMRKLQSRAIDLLALKDPSVTCEGQTIKIRRK